MGSVASQVLAVVEPIVREQGLSLWDLRYVKEGAYHFLRITVDKPGGVSIDDCEKLSRAVDGPVERCDIPDEQYFLEVCSAGSERDLFTDEQFEAAIGGDVRLKRIRPEAGVRDIEGVLIAKSRRDVTVQTAGGQEFTLPLDGLAFIKWIKQPPREDEGES